MELLEADFAQLEHINQVIHNNTTYTGWSCFDTADLIDAYNVFGNPTTHQLTWDNTTSRNNIRYNFFIVSIEKESSTITKYTFEVHNTLWNGRVQINKSRSDENIPADDVSIAKEADNDNKIIIRVRGDYRNSVRVCFALSMLEDGRTITTKAMKIIEDTNTETPVVKKTYTLNMSTLLEFTHQYNEEKSEKGRIYFLDNNRTAVPGAKVEFIPTNQNGIPVEGTNTLQPYTATTDKDGYYWIKYSKVGYPSTYYGMIKCNYQGQTVINHIKINKIQKHSIQIDWGNESNYKGVYKSGTKAYTIGFRIRNEYGKYDSDLDAQLAGLTVNITTYGVTDNVLERKTSEVKKQSNGTYSITETMSYRNYFENTSRIRVSIPAQKHFPATMSEHLVTHEYLILDNINNLRSTLNDTTAPNFIIMKPGRYVVPANNPLEIKYATTIVGAKGGNVIFDGQGKGPIFRLKSIPINHILSFNVNLVGLYLTGGTPAIDYTNGGKLLVNKCIFKGNSNAGDNHRGCSIFMPASDYATGQGSSRWNTKVHGSQFHNNVGNEIQSVGHTRLLNNKFITNLASCLKQPEPKVVNVQAGDVLYMRNLSHIKVTDKLTTNHSYAKALCYVNKKGKFNGAGPSQLNRDNSLPLFDNGLNNQAYTYAIYYYPYENVRTTIVCSPVKGKERRATGHASSIKGWVYYDGYRFNRISQGRGNRKDPFTADEIGLVENQGVYDISKKKFDSGYDPRFNNCECFYQNTKK